MTTTTTRDLPPAFRSPSQPPTESRPTPDMPLGVAGFTFADLFDPGKLARLHDVFFEAFAKDAPEDFAAFDAYRATKGEGMTPEQTSDALLAAAPHVSRFVARLFGVEREVDTLRTEIAGRNPLFTFKRDFAKKRVLKDGAGKGWKSSAADAAHGDHVEFKITYSAESDGDYECRFVLYIFALDGRPLTLHVSDWYRFSMKSQSSATISLTYDRLLLGNGEYVVSVAIYKHLDMNDLSTARTFDLLDKSFQFKVFTEFPQDDSIFLPPATWRMENDSAARAVTHERSKLRLSRVGLSNSED